MYTRAHECPSVPTHTSTRVSFSSHTHEHTSVLQFPHTQAHECPSVPTHTSTQVSFSSHTHEPKSVIQFPHTRVQEYHSVPTHMSPRVSCLISSHAHRQSITAVSSSPEGILSAVGGAMIQHGQSASASLHVEQQL